MKNKGTIIAIIFVVLALVIIGVFIILNSKQEAKIVENAETSVSQESKDVYQFQAEDKMVQLGVDFTSLNMPKEKDYAEMESCAFEGLDKEYTYDHYVISTYPEGEIDKVKSVYFLDEEAQTTEGVKIGDTYDKMVEVYGEDYQNTDNQYTYEKEKTQIIFLVEDNVISQIEYNYVTE